MSSRKDITVKLLSAVVFQVLWAALVMTAGSRWSTVATAGTIVLTLLQVALCSQPFCASAAFIGLASIIGLAMDSLLTAAGVISPLRVIVPFPVAPVWLMGLWVAFASFIQLTLTYLRGRPLTQWLLGAVGGPLAYWSGARLGAIEFNAALPLTLASLALAWGSIFVLLFELSRRIVPLREGGEA